MAKANKLVAKVAKGKADEPRREPAPPQKKITVQTNERKAKR